MELITWLIILLFTLLHLVVEIKTISIVLAIRKAISPPVGVMGIECLYRKQTPPEGLPDQLYCQCPKHPMTLSSLEICNKCEDRVLHYDGAKYLDYAFFDSFILLISKRILSFLIGLLTFIIAVLRFYKLIENIT